VYNTFLEFEAKYFTRETMPRAIRAALAMDPVGVDAIVGYLRDREVDTAVSETDRFRSMLRQGLLPCRRGGRG
jgi:hypothetical protein